MYHGQSETKEPLHEGLVAGLGPLLDTVLVCSITGIIIIISEAHFENDLNGIVLTLAAFDQLFFGIGEINCSSSWCLFSGFLPFLLILITV